MQSQRIQDVYNAYFYFNNKRTLSTDLPSQLSITKSDVLTIFIDKTRCYDNQMIVHEVGDFKCLDKSLKRYESGHVPEVSVEPLANSHELRTWLSHHDFVPVFEHEFLELSLANYDVLKKIPDSITIERWGQSHVDDFLALLKTSGLECSNEVWSKKRELYCTDSFRCFVAKIEGKACAWATSFIEGDHAIFANAYTQENYRSQGCQTALLSARIVDAISLGIKVALTDVMPNTTSCKNCKSIGFSSVGIRHV